MANFTTKTIKEIFDGLLARYTILRTKQGDNSPILEKSVVKSLFYAVSGVASELWQLGLWIYKQCFPQTCNLTILKLWGDLVGVYYTQGKTANLQIELSNVEANFLPTGTVYKDLNSGLIFKTISQTAAIEGKITATVACSTSGPIGNLPVGTILNIANPLDGIPSTAIVASVAIEGSVDEEFEKYRKRVLTKYKSSSHGGSALDYHNWSMEVPGIVDALPYVLEENLVSIYLVGKGSGKNRNVEGNLAPNPFPYWENGDIKELTGGGTLLAVAKAIEGSKEGVYDRRPMCAKVKLLQPNYTGYSIKINGLNNTSKSKEIKEALISTLDSKRPHLRVLGYNDSKTKINKLDLASIVTEIIGEGIMTNFNLVNENGKEIDEETLGIGTLAYLSSLTINGTSIEV